MFATELLKNIVPAFSNFLIAGLCLLEKHDNLPAVAGVLMQIQFLVIHSFPFMMVTAFAIESQAWKKRVFWGLLIMYIVFAANIDGLFGIAQFAALTFSTYYGYMVKRERRAIGQLSARWGVSFIAFMIFAEWTGMSNDVNVWRDSARAPVFAFWYYLCLGAAEMTGLYNTALVLFIDRLGAEDMTNTERANLINQAIKRLEPGSPGAFSGREDNGRTNGTDGTPPEKARLQADPEKKGETRQDKRE